MKFALLGESGPALELAREISQCDEHQLVAGYEIVNREEFRRVAPEANCNEDWQAVLHGTAANAIIVSKSDTIEDRSDQLHKLAQAGLALIAVHPACEMLDAFQIQMVQTDTQQPIVAYYPGIDHPGVTQLRELIMSDNPATGEITRIEIQRSVESAERKIVPNTSPAMPYSSDDL